MRHRVVILGVIALSVAACGTTRKEDPKVLRLPPVASPAPGPLDPRSIAVAQVLAGGVVGERRYIHIDRAAPGEVRQAQTLFWDEPPPRLVERALVSSLRSKFKVVSGPQVTINADQRVVVRLDRFEEQTGGGEPAAAHVAFDATITQVASRTVVSSGRYCGSSPLAGFEPTDRARAFAAAVAKAADRLAADMTSGTASTGGC